MFNGERSGFIIGQGEREMFYLTTHSTHFIYGYMASDIWLRTILIVRKETRCRHIGYSYRLTARVLLYASSHRQDITYHGLCYTSRGALAGTRNSSIGYYWPFHSVGVVLPDLSVDSSCAVSTGIVLNTTSSHTPSTRGHQMEGRKNLFYLTTHSTHFIYGYIASDIW